VCSIWHTLEARIAVHCDCRFTAHSPCDLGPPRMAGFFAQARDKFRKTVAALDRLQTSVAYCCDLLSSSRSRSSSDTKRCARCLAASLSPRNWKSFLNTTRRDVVSMAAVSATCTSVILALAVWRPTDRARVMFGDQFAQTSICSERGTKGKRTCLPSKQSSCVHSREP